MNKDSDKMKEKILDLTMEILYLLTGEDYMVVKKTSNHVGHQQHRCVASFRSQYPETEPPSPSPTHETNNEEKILELTNTIVRLLTGEVPIRCEDVTVHFSMEEWEYVEGHKALYKDTLKENPPHLSYQDNPASGEFHTLGSSSDDAKEDARSQINKGGKSLKGNKPMKAEAKSIKYVSRSSPSRDTNTDVSTLKQCTPLESAWSHREDQAFSNKVGKLQGSVSQPTEHRKARYPSYTKEEPVSCNEVDITDTDLYPTEHTQTEYPSTHFEEEVGLYEGPNDMFEMVSDTLEQDGVCEIRSMSSQSSLLESRSPPFTEAENEVLARKVFENYSKLFGHLSAKTSLHEKNQIWKKVARYVSAAGIHRRTPEKCKKRFSDLKAKVKHKMARENQHKQQTGAGPLNVIYSVSENIIRQIIDLALVQGVLNVADTDAESRIPKQASEEPEEHTSTYLNSPGMPYRIVEAENTDQGDTSPARTSSDVFSYEEEAEDMSHVLNETQNETPQGHTDEYLTNTDIRALLSQQQEFNVSILESVRICNTHLGNLTQVVSELKDQIHTSNMILSQICKNICNVNETLCARNNQWLQYYSNYAPPNTSGLPPHPYPSPNCSQPFPQHDLQQGCQELPDIKAHLQSSHPLAHEFLTQSPPASSRIRQTEAGQHPSWNVPPQSGHTLSNHYAGMQATPPTRLDPDRKPSVSTCQAFLSTQARHSSKSTQGDLDVHHHFSPSHSQPKLHPIKTELSSDSDEDDSRTSSWKADRVAPSKAQGTLQQDQVSVAKNVETTFRSRESSRPATTSRKEVGGLNPGEKCRESASCQPATERSLFGDADKASEVIGTYDKHRSRTSTEPSMTSGMSPATTDSRTLEKVRNN